MGFQISPLNAGSFDHLFGKDSEALAKQGVLRVIADSDPGYPCRVSLQDAKVGESVLLMNYVHQPLPTPFRSSHAIYVREAAVQAKLGRNDVPEVLRSRLLSVRAFDEAGMIVDADVIEGAHLESLPGRMFGNDHVSYLHIHNARLGCYLALVERG